jgi:hypothetical protein
MICAVYHMYVFSYRVFSYRPVEVGPFLLPQKAQERKVTVSIGAASLAVTLNIVPGTRCVVFRLRNNSYPLTQCVLNRLAYRKS